MRYLIKIDRFAAWILFLGIILYFISGYGITKGLISPETANKIHLDLLSVIIIIAFVVHGSYATRLSLIRWKSWNGPTKFIWGAFFLSFLLGFIYIDQIYQPDTSKNAENIKPVSQSNSNSTSSNFSHVSETQNTSPESSSNTQNQLTVYTKTELAKYDGKNGNPAYLAVDGSVYDLSLVFQNGKHFSHLAGCELTNAFYSYHAKRALSKYPVVGIYQS